MKHIYLYTTETYRTKNWYKIGETIGDPLKRIKEQDNASNPEPLILIASWSVHDKITDKKVHKELESFGFSKLRGNREWFELSDIPQQDVESVLFILDDTVIEQPIELTYTTTPLHYSEIWWGCGANAPA